MGKQTDTKEFSYRKNGEIRYCKEVRIVGEGIDSKVVPFAEAQNIANGMGLDMVEINNSIYPPIIKICQYDKMIYELKKIAKKNKQNSPQLKEIQLSVNIAMHDLETKAKQAKKFIEHGDKVKVILTMKGRELTRREENKKSIFEFITMVDDFASAESMPKDEGNKTVVILKKKK